MNCEHGMPTPVSCVDCMDEIGLPPAPQRTPADDGAIVALYVTTCHSCDGTIYPGDEIVQDSLWIHSECAEPLVRDDLL